MSEVLGWTDVQKQTTKSEGFLGGGFTIIKLVNSAHLWPSSSAAQLVVILCFNVVCMQSDCTMNTEFYMLLFLICKVCMYEYG